MLFWCYFNCIDNKVKIISLSDSDITIRMCWGRKRFRQFRCEVKTGPSISLWNLSTRQKPVSHARHLKLQFILWVSSFFPPPAPVPFQLFFLLWVCNFGNRPYSMTSRGSRFSQIKQRHIALKTYFTLRVV